MESGGQPEPPGPEQNLSVQTWFSPGPGGLQDRRRSRLALSEAAAQAVPPRSSGRRQRLQPPSASVHGGLRIKLKLTSVQNYLENLNIAPCCLFPRVPFGSAFKSVDII